MMPKKTNEDIKLHIALLASISVIFIWSALGCIDYFAWGLKAFAVVAAGALILYFYRLIRLTNICYILLWIYAAVLLAGARYSCEERPLFSWAGYFIMGFTSAIIVREVLMLATPLKKGKWLFFIVVCICVAISAGFEILRWAAAKVCSAVQDQAWVSQRNMALCLAGAAVSLILLTGLHNKQMKKNFIYRLTKGFA